MKKLILAILTGVALIGLSLPAKAAVTTTNSTTGETFTMLTSGALVDYITVVPQGTNVVTYVYDLADTTLTYTNASYTNFVTYITNQVTSFVTTTGVTNSWTNTVKYVDVYTTGAATNSYTPIATYATPSASIGTFTTPLQLRRGLTISNDVAATVIVGYRSQ